MLTTLGANLWSKRTNSGGSLEFYGFNWDELTFKELKVILRTFLHFTLEILAFSQNNQRSMRYLSGRGYPVVNYPMKYHNQKNRNSYRVKGCLRGFSIVQIVWSRRIVNLKKQRCCRYTMELVVKNFIEKKKMDIKEWF